MMDQNPAYGRQRAIVVTWRDFDNSCVQWIHKTAGTTTQDYYCWIFNTSEMTNHFVVGNAKRKTQKQEVI